MSRQPNKLPPFESFRAVDEKDRRALEDWFRNRPLNDLPALGIRTQTGWDQDFAFLASTFRKGPAAIASEALSSIEGEETLQRLAVAGLLTTNIRGSVLFIKPLGEQVLCARAFESGRAAGVRS